jgi:hypothetical protein
MFGGQFDLRKAIGVSVEAELHEIEMPAFDSNWPTIFLYQSSNGIYSKLKLDKIALAEPMFGHGWTPYLLYQGTPPSNPRR